jgi:hypothetical protein
VGLEEKVGIIQNYLFVLLEQVRYSFRNIDLRRNVNQASLAEFSQSVEGPIYRRFEDTDGRLSELAVNAAGLAARVSSAEGEISSLALTAQGLSVRVSDAEGNI